jgi:hypothetical protein
MNRAHMAYDHGGIKALKPKPSGGPAMAAMPLREWTRRLGALPAEAYDCFMVRLPPCSRPSRTSLRGAEEAPSLTATARDDDGNMRSGRKNARGAGRTKDWNDKEDKNGVIPLDKESPIQAGCEARTSGSVRGAEE